MLIVAHECDDDALATLVLNHQRHVVHCVVVKSPGFGERRIEILRDIAAYTGATVVDKTIGMALRFTTMDDLGTARRVVVTTDSTTISGGAGTEERIAARAAHIREQIDVVIEDYARERLQERLGRLRGRLVTISVGGLIPSEREDRRRRTAAGLNAAINGIASGAVVGGGITLLRLKGVTGSTSEINAGKRMG